MAKFEKGHKLAKGRPKGVPNKTTQELKETINKIVSISLDNYLEDIEKVRKQDPMKALQLSKDLIEYVMPKMSKMELSGEINHKVEKLTIEIKKGTVDGSNN
jgi:hypothetical protein